MTWTVDDSIAFMEDQLAFMKKHKVFLQSLLDSDDPDREHRIAYITGGIDHLTECINKAREQANE